MVNLSQRILSRMYNTLLKLYPEAFQSLFAEEMAAIFQMQLADFSRANQPPPLLFGCREVAGLLRGIAIAHWQTIFQSRKPWLGIEASMLEINSKEVTPTLRKLFRMDGPQTPRCFTVLDGNIDRGRILCDNPSHPTWAVVQELYDGCLYWGGNITRTTLAQVFDTLRVDGEVLVGIWLDDPRIELVPPNPDYDGRTLEFFDRPLGQGLEEILKQLPEGFELRRLDRDLILQTAWGPNDVAHVGGIENWEKSCFGYCLMHNGEILSEATVGPPALGLYEPGVFTQESHRGKGYATLTVARLIQEIEAQGGQTYWDCAKQNVASACVARKLGYQVEKEYRCMVWNKLEHVS